MTRRQAREQAFIIIFEKSFNEDMSVEELIENAVEAETLVPDDFAVKLVNSVFDNIEKIDNNIEENLKGWTKDRISKVSIAVLRLAIAEMLLFDDIPNGVSINEAVELAKTYAPQGDSSFVNGVLSSVNKKIGE
ncbi:MAG: transcription antitermination factor NusB [Clostridiales bacterium]|nr:transcription antitermination factor NusB [Clostridiales bacterium]